MSIKDIEERTDPNNFSLMIQSLAKDLNCTIMDAIVYYCENNNVEIETAAKMINKSLKAHLQYEAEDLNMMKNKTRRLPL